MQLLWIGLLYCFCSFKTEAFPVTPGSSPRSALHLTLKVIKSAKKELLVNVYEIEHPRIAEALSEAVRRGIRLDILTEGAPVGGFSERSAEALTRIRNAMRANPERAHRIGLFKSTKEAKKRYRFNHAKYVVVDRSSVMVGSENFSINGQADLSEPGVIGSRGWQAWLKDRAIAEYFYTSFTEDADRKEGDLEEYLDESSESLSKKRRGSKSGSNFLEQFDATTDWNSDALLAEESEDDLEADEATPIFSPQESLEGLLQLLQSAEKSIDLELMAFASMWGRTQETSPLLLALEEAAERGVRVRVLLNDESAFSGFRSSKVTQNQKTIEWIENKALESGLPMEARFGNYQAMKVTYIHNKGVLIDGHLTLVSSINWNQNSIENNRETAVLLDSKAIFQFYSVLFEDDWHRSSSRAQPEGFSSGPRRDSRDFKDEGTPRKRQYAQAA